MDYLLALLNELLTNFYMYLDKESYGSFSSTYLNIDQDSYLATAVKIDQDSYLATAVKIESANANSIRLELSQQVFSLTPTDLTIPLFQSIEPTSQELKAALESKNMTLTEFLKYSVKHAQIAIKVIKDNVKTSADDIRVWTEETKEIDFINLLWAKEIIANPNTTVLWKELAALEIKLQARFNDPSGNSFTKMDTRTALLWQSNYTYFLLQSDKPEAQFFKKVE